MSPTGTRAASRNGATPWRDRVDAADWDAVRSDWMPTAAP